jgi:aspartate aminotransferase/aminotransferase
VDTYPDFRLTVERLEKAVTPKTRLLLINNPANPTGVAYREDEIRAFAEFAKKHQLLVISDEIYEAYSYDFPHTPFIKHYEHTIMVSGFSKTYAMPGWRLGYAVGPEEILDKMMVLQQYSFVCAPSPAQRAGIRALDIDVTPYIDDYRKKRDFVVQSLKDRFELTRPEGAFYVFPKVPWGDDDAFVRKAIENRVLIVPGRACSQKQTHFRLSYAAKDEDLARGVEILNRLSR